MDSNRTNRLNGEPVGLIGPGVDSPTLAFNAGNITLPETARELRCETAGNITFKSQRGNWCTWNVVAGERVNVQVVAVADYGNGTDSGMVVQAIY